MDSCIFALGDGHESLGTKSELSWFEYKMSLIGFCVEALSSICGTSFGSVLVGVDWLEETGHWETYL